MQVLIVEHLLILPVVNAESKLARQHQMSQRNYSIISASESKRIATEQPSNCNITKECHICPEDAVRDDAEYCVTTGWRQMRTCVDEETGERENIFESCDALHISATGLTAVLEFESFVAALLVLVCFWRRRLLQDKGLILPYSSLGRSSSVGQ